jgi:hypothetical protein
MIASLSHKPQKLRYTDRGTDTDGYTDRERRVIL